MIVTMLIGILLVNGKEAMRCVQDYVQQTTSCVPHQTIIHPNDVLSVKVSLQFADGTVQEVRP